MTVIAHYGLFTTSIPRRLPKYSTIFVIPLHGRLQRSPQRLKPCLLSTASATFVTRNKVINPPDTTLPPPLVLPVRDEVKSAFKYYLGLGRAYLSFYKTGLKAVWGNYNAARSIRAQLPPSTSPDDALSQKLLSRGEWQLLRRSRADMWKIPLFVLVFMVCGEFTPLVVVFMTGVVPRTCRFPGQVGKEREKLEMRRGLSFREGTLDGVQGKTGVVKELRPAQVLHVGRSLGLYPGLWDRFGIIPVGLIRGRLERQVHYLELDDSAIERCGGVGLMEIEEVRISLEERGVDVLGKNNSVLRTQLQSWLRVAKKEGIARLLLTRPTAWEKVR